MSGAGCLGLCHDGPLVPVETPEGPRLYGNVTPIGRRRASPATPPSARRWRRSSATIAAFFARQHKIVLENSGRIDPERIEEYIAADGYQALQKAAHAR